MFKGLRIAETPVFPDLKDGTNPLLGPTKDLYMMGKNFLKRLIILHGGNYTDNFATTTNLLFLLVDYQPGRTKIDKEKSLGVHQVTYDTFSAIITGKMSFNDAYYESEPKTKITKYFSKGFESKL